MFLHRFYMEIQRAGRPDDEAHVVAAVRLAARLNLPVVATHPVQFATAEDYEAHEARCASLKEKFWATRVACAASRVSSISSRLRRWRHCLPMCLRPSPTPARSRSAATCRWSWESRSPDFPTPGGMPIEEYFRVASFDGLEERLAHLYPDAVVRDQQRPRYVERLEFELGTILKMGFPGLLPDRG